jgi:predicted short-subunit dehydrogenase-like oxidoreductase (DUF2520 family)
MGSTADSGPSSGSADPAAFVVGAGRVGTALALRLQQAGWPLLGLWSHSAEGAKRARRLLGIRCAHGPLPAGVADAKVVILSVPDPEVPLVGGALLDAGLLRDALAVLHCGGGRPAQEALPNLAPALPVGTLHPLLAVASPGQAARALRGAHVAIEGHPLARDLARRLALAAGCHPFEVPAEGMGLYHAAAVLASNHTVALWHAARTLLQEVGLDHRRSLEVLLPLIRSAADNAEALGLPDALTGPVRRGDLQTVLSHLRQIRRHAPHLEPVYRAGTRAALQAARDTGASGQQPAWEALEQALSESAEDG